MAIYFDKSHMMPQSLKFVHTALNRSKVVERAHQARKSVHRGEEGAKRAKIKGL
jgi:hypothetical protein